MALSLTNNLGGGQRVAALAAATAAPTPQPLPTYAPEPTGTTAEVAIAPTGDAAPAVPTDQVAGGVVPTPQPTATTAAQTAPIMASVRIAPGDHRGSWIRITADRQVIYEGGMEAASIRDFYRPNQRQNSCWQCWRRIRDDQRR